MKLPGAAKTGVPNLRAPQPNLGQARALESMGQALTQAGFTLAAWTQARNKAQVSEATLAVGQRASEELTPFQDKYVDSGILPDTLRGERTGQMLGSEAQFLHFDANADTWLDEAAKGISDPDVKEEWLNKEKNNLAEDRKRLASRYANDLYTHQNKATTQIVESYLDQGDYAAATEAAEGYLDPTLKADKIEFIKDRKQIDRAHEIMETARHTQDFTELKQHISDFETGKAGQSLNDETRFNLETKMRNQLVKLEKTNTIQQKLYVENVRDNLQAVSTQASQGKPIDDQAYNELIDTASLLIMEGEESGLIDPYFDAIRDVTTQRIFRSALEADAFNKPGGDLDIQQYIDENMRHFNQMKLPDNTPLGDFIFSPNIKAGMAQELNQMHQTFKADLSTDFVGTLEAHDLVSLPRLNINGAPEAYFANLFVRQNTLEVESRRYGVQGNQILTKQERESAIDFFNQIGPTEAISYIEGVSEALGTDNGWKYYSDIMDDRWAGQFAVAGQISLYSEDSPQAMLAMQGILKGAELISAPDSQWSDWLKEIKRTQSKTVPRTFNELFPDNTGMQKNYENAYYALFAQRNRDLNEPQRSWSTGLHKSLVKELVGEHGKWNGQQVLSPSYDFPFDEFENWVNNMSSDAISRARGVTGEGVTTNDAKLVARMVRDQDLFLENSEAGRNVYILKTKNGKYLRNRNQAILELRFDPATYLDDIEAGKRER